MAIKPSPRFAVLLLFIHATVGIVLYLTAIPLPVRLMLLLLITLSLFYHLARDVFLLLSDSWCEIMLDQGGMAVVTRGESKIPGRIVYDTTVSSHFVVLRVKLEGHHLPDSRVIFPDALSAGVFRELCVRLKFA